MSAARDKDAACPAATNPELEIDKIGEKATEKNDKKNRRSVSFPIDNQLVTQYFEPANPWQEVSSTTRAQIAEDYEESCRRHNTPPIESVVLQIRELPENCIGGGNRAPLLSLAECSLIGTAPIDALESLLSKVQFKKLEIDHAEIDDEGAEAIFDMIEYYESATMVSISGPRQFGIRGWQAASRMIKKSACVRGVGVWCGALAGAHAGALGRALRHAACALSALHLARAALTGDALLSIVIALKSNTSIRELRLPDNDLTPADAQQIGSLLKFNNHIQLLDLSNNQIQDAGLAYIADALVEQAAQTPPSANTSPLSPHSCPLGSYESRGLAFLVLWNNQLTRNCAPHLTKALRSSSSLCVLNVGRNPVGAECVRALAAGGPALHSVGLQAARLGPDAAGPLGHVLRAARALQRLDLRDNRLGVVGLQAILNALSENKTITQIDLDDPVETTTLTEDSTAATVGRLTRDIRAACRRNEPPAGAERRVHRKISLTCHTVCNVKSAGCRRLRSPLPSPGPSPAASPAGSPVPHHHHASRFSVTRVTPERESSTDSSSPSTPTRPTMCSTPSRFKVVQVVEPPQIQVHPAKRSSRFSVTRNYDSIYNPSPSASPNASPTPSLSPTPSNSSDSPRMGSDSPRICDSPRISDSPRSSSDSPRLSDSPRVCDSPRISCNSPRSSSDSPKVCDSPRSSDSPRNARENVGVPSDDIIIKSDNVRNLSATSLDTQLANLEQSGSSITLSERERNISDESLKDPTQLILKETLDHKDSLSLSRNRSKTSNEKEDISVLLQKDCDSSVTLSQTDSNCSVFVQRDSVTSSGSECDSPRLTASTFEPPLQTCFTCDKNGTKSVTAQERDSVFSDGHGKDKNNDDRNANLTCDSVRIKIDSDSDKRIAVTTYDNIGALRSDNRSSNIDIPARVVSNTRFSISPSPVNLDKHRSKEIIEIEPETVISRASIYDPIPLPFIDSVAKDGSYYAGYDTEISSFESCNVKIDDKIDTGATDTTKCQTVTDSDVDNVNKNAKTYSDAVKSETKIYKDRSENVTFEKDIFDDIIKTETKLMSNTVEVTDVDVKTELTVITESVKTAKVIDKEYVNIDDIVKKEDRAMKQIVSITEDLGNIIKEMRDMSCRNKKNKDSLVIESNVPAREVVLKKNKSESSLDSPDFEVSRLMNKKIVGSPFRDSSSSLEISGSSMESLNTENVHKPVIIQECAELELDRRKVELSTESSMESTSDTTPVNTGNLLNMSMSSNESVSPIIFSKNKKIHDSLSSLEVSMSSLDSAKQERVMVTSADSGIEYSLHNPPEKEDASSNEGTLTHNSSLRETVRNNEIQETLTSSPKRASSLLDVPALKSKGLDRMRKISWVAPSSSFHIPKNEEKEKPSHLEKLLSLFQNPTSIFSRNTQSDDEKRFNSNTPPRKDSSLTSSFWSWGAAVDRDEKDDSSEATDTTLSERVQVSFVDESFSKKLDSKTPSTDTDNTLSEFQTFQNAECNETTDDLVQKIDLSYKDDAFSNSNGNKCKTDLIQPNDLNMNDYELPPGDNNTISNENEAKFDKDVNREEVKDQSRPRSFAAVLKSSGSENSLDKQASPDAGPLVNKLPSKVIRGIKENISPENTLTSSMTNTLAIELIEKQIKNQTVVNTWDVLPEKIESKTEDVKVQSDLAPIATIEETCDETADDKIDLQIEANVTTLSTTETADIKELENVDLGKDALSYLIYESRDFEPDEAIIATKIEGGSLAQELKEAEIKEMLDLSPELVIDEAVEVPESVTKEIKGLKSSPAIPERAKLKKSNSLENLSQRQAPQEKISPKTKCIAFKIPETSPRDIPERRTKLRTRSGSSPKSLPESLIKPCSFTKMEPNICKKKKKVSSLGKMARDSLLALNMSDEEIAEFRKSYKLTSVESLRSLESVSEDANSQSGTSIDSRCKSCLRTSQESLMSLDSITEDCKCGEDNEKKHRSVR